MFSGFKSHTRKIDLKKINKKGDLLGRLFSCTLDYYLSLASSSSSVSTRLGSGKQQSTGHTSTQSVNLHFTQASPTMNAMERDFIS